MKVAYFCEPQLGGTLTFFQTLRPALRERGIDFFCISMMNQGDYPQEHEGVHFLGVGDLSEIRDPRILGPATCRAVQFLQRHEINLIMTLAGGNIFTANLAAYLPATIRATMNVPMMTRGAYVPVKTMCPYLDLVFAVSDRIRDDLCDRYGVAGELIDVIYHGIEVEPFFPNRGSAGQEASAKLLYAGRLSDGDKGVFLLPEMMRQLVGRGMSIELLIAGSGPDEHELRQRFARAGVLERVNMLGNVPHKKLLDLYKEADIFVFPSRFEGCGFSVLEAMAAGCAPVISDIRGSLRVIVANGSVGCLAVVGDPKSFADQIEILVRNPCRLREIKELAYRHVASNYTIDQMTDRYARSFEKVMSYHSDRRASCDLDAYAIPRGLLPTWRRWIPQSLKNRVRTVLERKGISS
jgi:glycosyltransferase involved in cell wall biosynthesis